MNFNSSAFTKQTKNRIKQHNLDIVKVLIVAVVVFSIITIKNLKTSQTPDDILRLPNDFDQQISQAIEFNSASHQASGLNTGSSQHSSILTYKQLCSDFSSICSKTTFNGDFSDWEKTSYFAQILKVIMDLDTIKTQWYELAKIVTQIIVNQASGSRRGSSWRTKLTLNLWTMKYDNEFFQVFTHEMGHILDLWGLNWKSSLRSSLYTEFGQKNFTIDDPSIDYYKLSRDSENIRKSWLYSEDFCSGYGMSDPFEDFAECHNLYLNHHNLFLALSSQNQSLKDKYTYFDTLYGQKYFSDSEKSLSTLDNLRRPWDSTRIFE